MVVRVIAAFARCGGLLVLLSTEVHMANGHDTTGAEDSADNKPGPIADNALDRWGKPVHTVKREAYQVVPKNNFPFVNDPRKGEAADKPHQKLALADDAQKFNARLSFGDDAGYHLLGNVYVTANARRGNPYLGIVVCSGERRDAARDGRDSLEERQNSGDDHC